MWVLWAYCPRRMVARPGQHKGKVEVVLVNLTPWLVMSFFRAGILFSVPGNWSSLRTKMMLGLPVAACLLRGPALGDHANSSTDDATATDNPTKANTLTSLSIPITSLGAKEEVSKDPRPVT